MNVIKESRRALRDLNWSQVDHAVDNIKRSKRLFVIGNGGGYAHAQHFASDLRKIAGVDAYSFDNITEMTARINDQGWEAAWCEWMNGHHYGQSDRDRIFMFSVGGALDGLSKNIAMGSWGIVGAEGAGRWNRIVVPSTATPVIEGCQSVIAHHIVEQLCK